MKTIYVNIIKCVALILLFFSCQKNSESKFFLGVIHGNDHGWEQEHRENNLYYSLEKSDKFKTMDLKLKSDTLHYLRWFKKVGIKPYSKYRLTGYVQTKDIVGEHPQSGVGIRIGNFKIEKDTTFVGTNDWTLVEIEFDSEGYDSVLIEAVMGKEGKAMGEAAFNGFVLEELWSKQLEPFITLDMKEEKEPLSELIYGQFIEHMGRSIYGGIWSEMLEDRKFYYKPGDEKSPWLVDVETNNITIDSTYSYSRGKVPVFTLNGASFKLGQNDLAIVENRGYDGRLTLKNSSLPQEVKIKLYSENKLIDSTVVQVADVKGGYQKIKFHLKSTVSSEQGRLVLEFDNVNELRIAAISLMPDDNVQGFRKDVLELLKRLDAPIYRWPGGNFVSGYDWEDGIGDPDTRPTRFDLAWNGLEYNDVGIQEFMELCHILNTQANIAVNTGFGTAEMAAKQVEFVNGSTQTQGGQLRAKNGHAQPYNVELWAVGNEMFGDWQLGHMPLDDYVKKHKEVAEAMWKADPKIKLIGIGFPGEWNEKMYQYNTPYMDFISEHFYRQDWHSGGLLTHVRQIPDAIREIAEEHREQQTKIDTQGKTIKIAMDEWNYWYGPHVYGLLGTRYYLRDALGIAAGINEFSRQSDIYYMANYAQTVNVIGAIKTSKTDSFMAGTGLVLELYRNYFGQVPITIDGNSAPLDVAATLTQDRKYLTLSVINATNDEYPLKIDFGESTNPNKATHYVLSGADDMVFNEIEHKDRIQVRENEIIMETNEISIPRLSANIYKFSIEQ